MKEVFTLLLTSDIAIADGGFVLDSTNNSNVKYQVDFNALFQGRNRVYNKCQVRSQIITNSQTGTTINLATGILSMVGGISTGNSLGTNGLFLMILNPSAASVSGSGTGFFYAGVSSLSSTNGTQITAIPSGVQEFYITYTNVTTGAIQADTSMPNYRLMLQFELYDPIV